MPPVQKRPAISQFRAGRLGRIGLTSNLGKGTDKLTAAERQSQDEKTRIGVQTPPISTGDHSTRGLALLSLQLELP
jgi:hypothetical protein